MAKKDGLAFFKLIVLFLPFILGFTLLHIFGKDIYETRKRSSAGVEMDKLQTKRFIVYARNAGSYEIALANKMEDFTEAFYKEYREIFMLKDFDAHISVWLLESKETLQSFAHKQLQKDLAFNGGFYNPIKKDIAIILSGNQRIDEKALFHEITHAIFDQSSSGADWSSWFAEGLATYFEESRIIDMEIKLGGGNAVTFEDVKLLIKRDSFIPLAKFVKAQQESFQSQENEIYYNQAHTLLYFLLSTPDYRKSFQQYYAEERKAGPCQPYAFESAFGDFEEIQKNWQQFILTKKD